MCGYSDGLLLVELKKTTVLILVLNHLYHVDTYIKIPSRNCTFYIHYLLYYLWNMWNTLSSHNDIFINIRHTFCKPLYAWHVNLRALKSESRKTIHMADFNLVILAVEQPNIEFWRDLECTNKDIFVLLYNCNLIIQPRAVTVLKKKGIFGAFKDTPTSEISELADGQQLFKASKKT